jgi:Tol biopolymer transport system component
MSSDGQFVAFEIMGGPLCVMKTDGSDYRELGDGHRPCFSPDGRRLVFMVTQDDGHDYLAADLFVMAVDGRERQPLTQSGDKLEMNPSWSPDGRHIAFDVINEGAIYILNVASE